MKIQDREYAVEHVRSILYARYYITQCMSAGKRLVVTYKVCRAGVRRKIPAGSVVRAFLLRNLLEIRKQKDPSRSALNLRYKCFQPDTLLLPDALLFFRPRRRRRKSTAFECKRKKLAFRTRSWTSVCAIND